MYWKEHVRYIISILIALALLVFVLILMFGGGSSKTPANNKPDMTQYIGTDAVMQLTADGPIVSEEKHQAVRISVSSSQVTYERLQGYEGAVAASQTYPSNSQAYESFVRALSILGYDKGNDNPKLADEKGYCPTGVRYIFAIQEGTDQKQRYWRGSCGSGTFQGTYPQIVSLFRAQVPNMSDLMRDVTFGF